MILHQLHLGCEHLIDLRLERLMMIDWLDLPLHYYFLEKEVGILFHLFILDAASPFVKGCFHERRKDISCPLTLSSDRKERKILKI